MAYVSIDKDLNVKPIDGRLDQVLIGSAHRNNETILLFRENTGEILKMTDLQKHGGRGSHTRYTWNWELVAHSREGRKDG